MLTRIKNEPLITKIFRIDLPFESFQNKNRKTRVFLIKTNTSLNQEAIIKILFKFLVEIWYRIMAYQRLEKARLELEAAKRNLSLAENEVNMEVQTPMVTNQSFHGAGNNFVYGEVNMAHIEDITNCWERRFDEMTIKHDKLASRVRDCEAELQLKQGGDCLDLRDKLTEVNERQEFGSSQLYDDRRRPDRRAPLQNGRNGGRNYDVERREYQTYDYRGRRHYRDDRGRNDFKQRKYAN